MEKRDKDHQVLMKKSTLEKKEKSTLEKKEKSTLEKKEKDLKLMLMVKTTNA